MKCIYCKQELRDDPYQGREGEEIDCEVGGATMTVYVHSDCMKYLVGEYIEQRIRSVNWVNTRTATSPDTSATLQTTKSNEEWDVMKNKWM